MSEAWDTADRQLLVRPQGAHRKALVPGVLQRRWAMRRGLRVVATEPDPGIAGPASNGSAPLPRPRHSSEADAGS
ncbi:MAG: hypothetical protein ACRDPG_09365 [Nocardioidaceae bacterium]